MNINIKLTGNKKLERALEELSKRSKNMRPVMDDMGNYLQNIMEESFESGRAANGEVWTPLADSTLIKKHKDGSMHSMGKLLQAEGTLLDSISYDSDSKGLVVGVNAYSDKGYPYPVVHQFGSEDGKIPARPFMPISDSGELYSEVENELIDLLEDFLRLRV